MAAAGKEKLPDGTPYRLGGMGYQDASGRRLSYGSYLHIPELLELQGGLTAAHDELLFIVVHQVYELWFKVLIHELEAVRSAIEAEDLRGARHFLARVKVIEALLVEQVGVLETMAPQDFLTFRSELAPASGFQSAQFREIEFLSGLKDAGYIKALDDAEARARLQQRLAEPSLLDVFTRLLDRRGVTVSDLYRQGDDHADLLELAEALLDHDEGFRLWRLRHVEMVERQIGDKPGTGGSTGVRYLQSTLGKRFFPQLWEVRSQL
ncbi:MAG TPA: tryptophan 2,3-dioxygenase family protein [Candidatus Dormibacteraeota bacterium]|nr:tryptophan 2,3-dioxygenase family protein [Candidatus Dormibacteraeota bacterium]